MGCASSTDKTRTEMERAVHLQNKQITSLEKANKELKQLLDQIIGDTQRSKKQENTDLQVQERIRELEGKIQLLESQLQQKRKNDLNDTFSRDSEPDILVQSRQPEVTTPPPKAEERPSASILDDPSIKEMYERKRQLFQRKLNPPSATNPNQPS